MYIPAVCHASVMRGKDFCKEYTYASLLIAPDNPLPSNSLKELRHPLKWHNDGQTRMYKK